MAVRRSTRSIGLNGATGIRNYFYWKAAHRAAWRNPSPGIVAFRIRKAERLGLTYEEYTLEILGRGRHLQVEDVERLQRSSGRALPSIMKVNFAENHPHVEYPDQSLEPFARHSRDAQ
jgi:hypothetical protein